VTLG
jgi:predicted nucleic acid-binding protein